MKNKFQQLFVLIFSIITILCIVNSSANASSYLSIFSDEIKGQLTPSSRVYPGYLLWPLSGKNPLSNLTSHVGWRDAEKIHNSQGGTWPSWLHHGIDVGGVSTSQVVVAAASGKAYSGYQQYSGYYVIIDHGNGWYTEYQHLSKFAGRITQGCQAVPVNAGCTIGYVGNSGGSYPVHFHFEIAYGESGKATSFFTETNNKKIYAYSEPQGKTVSLPWASSWEICNPEKQRFVATVDQLCPTDNTTTEFYEWKYPLYTEYALYKGKNDGEKHYVCNIPYAWSTNETSQSIVKHLTVLPSIGQQYYTTETFLARGVYENAYGHIWYEVTTGGGQTGYIYSGDVTYVGMPTNYSTYVQTSGINISDCSTVDINAGYYKLTGKITIPSRIDRVEARVLDSSGADALPVAVQYCDNTSVCNLAGSINNQLSFGKLTKGAYYTYQIKVYALVNQKETSAHCYTYEARFWTDDNSGRTPTFGTNAIMGDVNDDGIVDLVDIMRLANYVYKDSSIYINKMNSDINGDGKFDLGDIMKIAHKVYKE